jgi:hypothetical protein
MKKTTLPKQVSMIESPVSIPCILTKDEIDYLECLDSKEKQAYEIAKSHLGSTFHLIKSNGFIDWKKKTGTDR